ncbi:GAF domain-containing protein [Flavobacterium sp. MAH-1]|uniref:GAF domain-containing protein n=1 Tax=Flavobacterium agri TaxID=2743471 RepID=A0A7Y8Y3T6_9FLAO|nr:GAF domain-containing protein [Flavobacterium agri]NUY81791.1 GAF domain-containing protein [Flavobacterium agri]NYA71815.1 GAF domain-containing protein [Flavobacterium agri]
MSFEKQFDNPFRIEISFHKVIEALEEIAMSDVDFRANYAKGLLAEVAKVPELRTGISDLSKISEHAELIRHLLADLFPTALSKNEIKAVTIPFHQIIFNHTERFQNILLNAGPDFDMGIRDFDEHQFYVMSSCMILKFYYGYDVDFARPVFYDIPEADGSVKHYRILYNADFLEIFKTDDAPDITPEDIALLIDNFDNFDLWKEKFPVDSWILRGFGIMNLYDNTVESAVSLLKESLLTTEKKRDENDTDVLQGIFRSIFKIRNLRLGFAEFHPEEQKFRVANFGSHIPSVLLGGKMERPYEEICGCSMDELVTDAKYLAISDVKKFAEDFPEEKDFANHLLSQDVQSCIFAPIMKNGRVLGVFEVVSSVPKELNSINANKLDFVLPFITDTMDRYYSEKQNYIDAIIQKEYTAIHPSVYWKFREEADLHTIPENADKPFREIIFKDVYPMYGQIDIKGSSVARNEAMQRDLKLQIEMLLNLLRDLSKRHKLPLIEQHLFELEKMEGQILESLKADSESIVQNYIFNEIHPMLDHFRSDAQIAKKIGQYESQLDPAINMVYKERKNFDDTLSLINKKMAAVLDKKQEEAQEFFPHYYERFKTDGVEHNLYIGASIAPKKAYNPIYLDNLRLWQLQAMCDLEIEYFRLRPGLPYELDVTSLILVYSVPISIRFRMDEKRFDVDGTYNARYEVVKKRIDKSHIKGTGERIVQAGKITIVYSQNQEEAEYRRYIRLLQYKNRLGNNVESFEVEDLQGVTGLRALRVEVLYQVTPDGENYTFDDLVKELDLKP